MSANDRSAPTNAKLDAAWTLVAERFTRIVPHDKLLDLEHAAELHLALNPSLTAVELTAWIAAPYAPRSMHLPRKRRPFTGRTLLAEAPMTLVWSHMQLRYGRAYADEVRAHLAEQASTFVAAHPDRTVTALTIWLREQNHARKYPKA
jgi:predicted nucleotidyltransferase